MSYHYSSSHSMKRRSYIAGWLIFCMIVSLILIGYWYREKLIIIVKPTISHLKEKIYWIGSRKVISSKIADVASIEQEKPIHFEFYSTLPAMAVNISEGKEIDIKNKNNVRVAKNTSQDISPFASSRDDLVREFALKLSEPE